jgi:hypothetical protein
MKNNVQDGSLADKAEAVFKDLRVALGSKVVPS